MVVLATVTMAECWCYIPGPPPDLANQLVYSYLLVVAGLVSLKPPTVA